MDLYDAHNHIHDTWLGSHREQVFSDLASVGVRTAVVNGTSEMDWPEVAALCGSDQSNRTSDIKFLPAFGLHPWDVGNRSPHWQENLLAQFVSNPSASIGEIGLDRWILDRARPDDARLIGLRRAPLDEQIDVFRWQLALAAERNLPASIHCLDAFGALHDVLRGSPLPARGFLLHAYSGPMEMIGTFAKLGAYFSFNGAFLEVRKERLRKVYAAIPADRLLVETDAPAMRLPLAQERFPPFASPENSFANHPANLAASYAGLAEIRGLPLEEFAANIAKNFARLFSSSI